MALYFSPIFEHYEAFLLVFTTNTDVICFFKLLRYSNLCRVLPENGVPYSDILLSLVVFDLDQNAIVKICQLQLQETEINGVGFIESALQWSRAPFLQLTMEN